MPKVDAREAVAQCYGCSKWIDVDDALCADCERQERLDQGDISMLEKNGHTPHCARRIIWGDGDCECGFDPAHDHRPIDEVMPNVRPPEKTS